MTAVSLPSPAHRRDERDLIPLTQARLRGNKLEVDGNHRIIGVTTQGLMSPAVLSKKVPCRDALRKLKVSFGGAHNVFDGREKLCPNLHADKLLRWTWHQSSIGHSYIAGRVAPHCTQLCAPMQAGGRGGNRPEPVA